MSIRAIWGGAHHGRCRVEAGERRPGHEEGAFELRMLHCVMHHHDCTRVETRYGVH